MTAAVFPGDRAEEDEPGPADPVLALFETLSYAKSALMVIIEGSPEMAAEFCMEASLAAGDAAPLGSPLSEALSTILDAITPGGAS